ncbi:MAG: ribonuclease E inhibitor RraB [Pseudomonadota bacterium]
MAAAIPNKTIFIERLREMFANIAEDTDWDMSQPMLWGHFFTHHEPGALEEAIPRLMAMGLDVVDIFIADKEEEGEPDLYWLHMQEVRVHTPEILDARNDEFYVFAHREGLDSYDGMDVGPVLQ